MRTLFPLVIVLAGACACGRLLSTQRVYEPSMRWPALQPRVMPTFSSNDRSRWATVRALVDEGTWVIGKRDPKVVLGSALAPLGHLRPLEAAALLHVGYHARINKQANTGIIFEDGYESVDKVLHPATLDYYSSKPPLFTAIIAGIYWLLQTLFGWTLSGPVEERSVNAIVRTTLVIVNIIPFMIYLWLLGRLVERWSRSDWTKLLVVVAAGFATLVSPFLITLNNHTLGTFAATGALYAAVRVYDGRVVGRRLSAGWLALAGLLAGLATCMELPALALLASLMGLFFLWAPVRMLVFYLPAALVPLAAFFAANWLAVGQLEPAYSEFGGPWYEYEGSHWRKPMPTEIKRGIDWARLQETRQQYALHVLVGHHGWFSLTPLWLLALPGMIWGTLMMGQTSRLAGTDNIERGLPWFIPPLTLVLSAVVIGFYLYKSDNYSGFSVGLRWLMWLTPLWLVCLIPIADRLASWRLGRWFTYGCLAASAISANYSPWNPWRHPWIYDLLVNTGWWSGY
jgi:hypothetical protein